MIRLFISEWDGRCNWLQTTAEHDIVWRIWTGDHCELSCVHLNREWQFHVKSHELIGAFLAFTPDWARGLHCYAPNTFWLPGNCSRLLDSLSMLPSF